MEVYKQPKLVPFLKWAGGKRWLIDKEPQVFPQEFNTYFEPFLGSAAVYFFLRPQSAVLSDLNQELVDTYNALKSDWKLVRRYLMAHNNRHSKDYYYEVRAQRPRSLYSRAARMLYLNRTCWNGLYRVNLKGEFNVPIGTKKSAILDTDDFEITANQLNGAEIICRDFEEIIDSARLGDFVFVDPPYTVKHNFNGFIKYNETLFAWDDQVRLKKTVDRAVSRGVKVLVLNAAHASVEELYSEYEMRKISRKNVLSGKSEFRGSYEELLVKCW